MNAVNRAMYPEANEAKTNSDSRMESQYFCRASEYAVFLMIAYRLKVDYL